MADLLARPVAISRPFTDPAGRPAAEAEARATLEAIEGLAEPPHVARADRLPAYRLLAGLRDERLVRDSALLDELRAASGISTGELTAFLERLDRSGELIEANASPELVLDVLVLSWPRRPRAA